MCSIIQSNPDIAGIGVRLAFYAQSSLCFIMAYKFPGQEERGYHRTLQSTNLSLIVSALIQFKTESSLSVIDTILVSMMSVMLLSCMYGMYPGFTKFTGRFDASLCSLSHASTSAWGIFVWVHAKGCESDTVFVLFGHNISVATRSLQIFAISFFAYVGMMAICEINPRSFNWNNPRISLHPIFRRLYGDAGKKTTYLAFYSIFLWISVLVSIEQTIQRNNQRASLSGWTFGQTLALSATGLSFVQTGSAWKKHWPDIMNADGFSEKLSIAFCPAPEVGKPDCKSPTRRPTQEREISGTTVQTVETILRDDEKIV